MLQEPAASVSKRTHSRKDSTRLETQLIQKTWSPDYINLETFNALDTFVLISPAMQIHLYSSFGRRASVEIDAEGLDIAEEMDGEAAAPL